MAHSGQLLKRSAAAGGFAVEACSSMPDHRTYKKRKINNMLRKHGLLHVGAATLACGLGQCNQGGGISAWSMITDCWNAQMSDRSHGAAASCLCDCFHFIYEGKYIPELSVNNRR